MNIFNIHKKDKKNFDASLIKSSKKNSYFDEITDIKNVEGFYNVLTKLANPDEVLKMTGKGIECLSLIENTGDVATCIDSRKAGVTSLNWQLIHKNDKKYKEFYDELFKNQIDVFNIINDILNAPLYGFQPIEIVWEKAGNYIIPKEIQAKPQEWFFYNNDRELCFKAKGHTNGIILSTYSRKILCPRHKPTFKNPYGQALLSRCFWDVAFIKGGFEFWAKFMEKYGMPFLSGKYPDGASDEVKEQLLACLEKMAQDAVSVMPDNSTFEIKDAAAKSASAQIYEKFIIMCQKNISKNILGQTLTTDAGEKGSYAIGKVHANVREDIIDSDKRMVEKEINLLIRWIHELNFNDNDYPEFQLYEEEDVDMNLANRDKVLSETGVRFTKKYFVKTYGFEDDDIEIVQSEKFPGNENEFAEAQSFDFQEEIDKLSDYFDDEILEKLIEKSIFPIVQEFSKIKDPEKAMEELVKIYPSMDSKELEQTLTKAVFLADLIGRASVKAEKNVR